ncbi:hypothetical protein [Vogesella sp. EB]|uniref:hypothetical protein n=1 Tax=Vogesella sp. EB TaxID=1526735 RepID=UPI0012E08E19|nr:hypothetical protein [Vogesella sp. EB]
MRAINKILFLIITFSIMACSKNPVEPVVLKLNGDSSLFIEVKNCNFPFQGESMISFYAELDRSTRNFVCGDGRNKDDVFRIQIGNFRFEYSLGYYMKIEETEYYSLYKERNNETSIGWAIFSKKHGFLVRKSNIKNKIFEVTSDMGGRFYMEALIDVNSFEPDNVIYQANRVVELLNANVRHGKPD